jgi:predicted ester cyclase
VTKRSNETLIRRLTNEVWNAGNLSRLNELYAPDSMRRTLPELAATVTSLRTALPDLHMTIDESIADEQKVVTRWTIHGTNLGHLSGLSGIDVLGGHRIGEDQIMPLVDLGPTGHDVNVSGVSVFHLENGKVTDCWGLIDRLGLLQQLPALPSPGLATI